jgi:Cu/Ag efflux protein CusF
MDQQPVSADDDSFWGTPEHEQAPPDNNEHPETVSSPPPSDGVGHPTRKWLAAAVGAAVIAVAAIVGINAGGAQTQSIGTAGAGGAGGARAGPGGGGAVTAIDGSTLTVTNGAGQTVKVLTSASTTFNVATAGSVGDLKAGDNVLVVGTTAGSTIAAQQVTDSGGVAIADGPGGPRAPPAASGGGAPANGGPAGNGANAPTGGGFRGRPSAGVVKTVAGDSFSLTSSDGTILTVTMSSSTTVAVLKPSSLGALKVGDQIQTTGTRASDGTITATSVRSGILPTGSGGVRGAGAAQ